MDLSTGMIGKTWIVYCETERVEVGSYESSARLLTIHANGKCFDTAKKKEGVNRCESISDRVDNEGHLLVTGGESRVHDMVQETPTFAISSLLHVITPAIKS